MEKVKSMWNGLSKQGKIFFGGVGVILVLIIINWFI
jgi:flagellar biosynthesis/type III secretory pathway M-ring protein FliF/YscJ|tara:strand:- start:283 stop:390 length:108 start_codon:yes stop_codon:yes gene_type:complete